jgi:hypothetical protein
MHEAVENGSRTTFSAIETGACAQIQAGLPLGVRAHCESHHKRAGLALDPSAGFCQVSQGAETIQICSGVKVLHLYP